MGAHDSGLTMNGNVDIRQVDLGFRVGGRIAVMPVEEGASVEAGALLATPDTRQMQRFKSMRQAQCFLTAHAFISGHFRPRRHLMTATRYRAARATSFETWTQETCARSAT
jgi:multidrug efflux pump subunit AcrA (membrane-fusion protein)